MTRMDDPPQTASLLRRPGCWITAMTVLPLLIGGVYFLENWWGARELARVKAELVAAGMNLEATTRGTVEPPAEDNFCATPLLLAIGKGTETGPELETIRSIVEWQTHARDAGTDFREPVSPVPTDWAALHEALRASDAELGLDEHPADPLEALSDVMERELGVVTTELMAAIDRPHAAFIPGYMDSTVTDPLAGGPVWSAGSLLRLSKAYRFRASLASAQGNGPRAVDSCRVILRLAEAAERDGPIICALVSNALTKMGLHAAWTAAADRNLDGPSYQRLADLWHTARPLDALAATLEAEMAFSLMMHTHLRSDRVLYLNMVVGGFDPTASRFAGWKTSVARFTPPGWFDANCASTLSLTHGMLRRVSDPSLPDRFILKPWMDRELAKGGGFPFHSLSAISMSSLALPIQRCGARHATCRLAEAACALEAHFTDHRSYPDSLTALVPAYLAGVPVDLDGQPVRYAPDPANGRYRLWSIGADGTDDGGVELDEAGGTPKPWIEPVGDWVWQYPK